MSRNKTKDQKWSGNNSCQCICHSQTNNDDIDFKPQINSTCSNCHPQGKPNWETNSAVAINYCDNLGIALGINHNKKVHLEFYSSTFYWRLTI